MTLLLFLKLTVTPVLVAVMSLVARRLGPALGGVILGLPWMTGPILFFLALERDTAYLETTSRGVLLAVPAIAAYAVAYGHTAKSHRWPASLAAGSLAFAATGGLLSLVSWPASVIAIVAVAALLLARQLTPPPRGAIGALTLPWWDIPARMAATGALVACIAVAADFLGPTGLGIVSSFPVIMTVMTTFSHYRWGVDVAMALLRSVMLSLIGFTGFFWVTAVFGASLGLVPSFVVATGVGIVYSVALLLWGRLRRR